MTRPRPTVPEGAGDSHNFHRRVTIEATRVHKPRTVLWEWLMLGEGSPLRALLAKVANDDGLASTFDHLPELRFESPAARDGGHVERLVLEPLGTLGPDERRALAAIVGRSLATWSFFGLSDLHWENLAIGRDPRGRTIFTPLDVELVLDDYALPTATKLVPEADPEYGAMNRHAAGVRRVLPFLGKPIDPGDLVTMAAAYRETLALLERHGSAIAEVVAAVPGLRDTPIRVLLRGTGDYVRARTASVWPPLLKAEATQLARGDIPYFFRLYGREGIHYFVEPTLVELGRLPLRGDVPRLEPLLSLEKGLRATSRASLREEGLFAILGAFDHPSFAGAHTVGELTVTFAKRSITIATSSGEELVGKRDLRAYVGSVYLPCRCGEVATPFVPAVTACRPEKSEPARKPSKPRK